MNALARLVTGRRSRWAVIGAWAVLLAAAIPFSTQLRDVTTDATADFVPSDSQSAEVRDIVDERFEGGDRQPVVLVYRRPGGLTAADEETILAQAREAAAVELAAPGLVPFGPDAGPGLVSEDGTVALTVIPLGSADQQDQVEAIEELREIVHATPEGLESHVTGNPALDVDNLITREEADAPLFAVTAILVLTLLMAIYRSPIVALVPLVTVGIAYTVASAILYLLADSGMTVTGTSLSLLLVLMFGATTDYCLLLVARYVEDLRRSERETDAMQVALPRAGPAILASGSTTIVALLTLSFASVALISSLGPVNAIGLAVGLSAALTLLPALITLIGRRGFWPSSAAVAYRRREPPKLLPGLRPLALPSVPVTDQHPTVREREGIWRRIGIRVLGKPVAALVAVLVFFGAGSLGLTQLDQDPNIRADIRSDTDGTRGFDVLGERFPPGNLAPATVLVVRSQGPVRNRDLAAAREVLADVPGIANLTPPTAEAEDASAVTFSAIFEDDPLANPALDRVETMRDALAGLDGDVRGLVGGPPGTALDFRAGVTADFRLVVPLVLGTILLIMIALLRAIVAPLYLLGSTVISFFGTLGIAVLLIQFVLGHEIFNPVFPVFAFIFLVALGVDYNIFLIDRVREEASEHGTRVGALRGVIATGPVITSAGLILAGTFAALLTVPLGTLQALGLTVSLGVLLDTFCVRTVFVPAILALVGDASWWPSKLGRGRARVAPGGSGISPVQSGLPEATSGEVSTGQQPARGRHGGP